MFVIGNTLTVLALGYGVAASGFVWLAITRARRALAEWDRRSRAQERELAFQRKALYEHTMVTVTATSGELLDVNKKFLETMGYRREEMIGKPLGDFYAPDDLHSSEEIRRVTALGRIWSGETHLLRADGTVAVTQSTVVPLIDDQGRHVKNMSLRFDISKSKLPENERMLTSAFDNMRDAVFVYEPETFRIVYMNKFALAEQGWSASDVGRKTIWDTDYAPNRQVIESAARAILRDGKSTEILDTPRRGRSYEAQSYMIGSNVGQPRVLTITRDVSDRAAYERERHQLISVITHELRTPLTSIKGALGLLDANAVGPMSTEAKSLVGIALKNSDRMLGLIREILDAEKAEQAVAGTELEPVDLAEAVNTAIVANRGYGAEYDVDFVDPGSARDLWVMGSEGLFGQILANLMSNAAKFSPSGSQVEVWASREGNSGVIHVRDHGMGISEELRPMLFERFTQARGVGATHANSSGLGLSIVRSMVEKLGGEIHYDTELNVGTTFHIVFPAMTERAVADLIGSKTRIAG